MGRHKRTKQETEQRMKELDETIYGSDRKKPFLVVTPLGSTIMNPSDLIFVGIGSQTYCEKPARDIAQGDRVIFEKKGIDIEAQRQKINELLLEGKIYRSAFEYIFASIVSPDEGKAQFRPRFLHAIMESMIEQPVLWGSVIEAERSAIVEIFEKGGELPLKIRSAAATIIYETLSKGITGRSFDLERIQGKWLTGQIIAPKEYGEIFEELSELTPQLGTLLTNNQFKQSYDFYLIARQSIFTRLSNIIHGRSHIEKSHRPRKENQKILTGEVRNELNLVVSYFGEEISANTALTTVLEVLPISSNNAASTQTQENTLPLRKGILTKQESEDNPSKVISLDLAQKRKVALSALYDHIVDIYAEYAVQRGLHSGRFVLSGILFCDRLFEYLGYPGYADKFSKAEATAKGQGLPTTDFSPISSPLYGADKESASKFYRTLLRGALDRRLGLSDGSCLEIIKQYAAYCTNMPYDIFYITYLEAFRNELQREGKRIIDVDTRVSDVVRKIRSQNRRTYITLKTFLQFIFESDDVLLDVIKREKIFDLRQVIALAYGGISLENDEIFEKLRPWLKSYGVEISNSDILTNAQCIEIYEQLGLGSYVSTINLRWVADQKTQFLHRPGIEKILDHLVPK